jgi:hypothetical protein
VAEMFEVVVFTASQKVCGVVHARNSGETHMLAMVTDCQQHLCEAMLAQCLYNVRFCCVSTCTPLPTQVVQGGYGLALWTQG